ncbi:MopE-related protein [Reichenbachiella sp. MALMAid0571]|uniref:MopE-related protein n=1 Tax=Reichenbachiella sp. MALMAid0571 TaxID=3143939 RepID=UPI0032DF89B6
MKKLLLLSAFILSIFQGFSQTKGISYQAVILNPNTQEVPGATVQNNILPNTTVGIQFTITDHSGTIEYQESHTTSTDKYGMINLLIGAGNPTSSNDFSDIFWDGNVKKLKVEIDFSGGSNYQFLNEQNLTYIPQPPTPEVSIGIETNTEAIIDETARAIAVEKLNATGISSLQTEQQIQNAAIALNTAKLGITTEQATTISNTTGINTGDQDISGIDANAAAVATEKERATKAELANEKANENEIQRATTAEEANATAISNEVMRATAAEENLAANLSTEIINRTNVAALKADLASPTFTGTVSGIDKTMVGLENVDNTSDANKPISDLTQSALDEKVDKVSGKGLSTEDYTTAEQTKLAAITGSNTGDQDISGIDANSSTIGNLSTLTTTTKSNLVAAVNELENEKADLASPTFTGTVSGIDKTMVGLENVDNTSDANKPISDLTQSALDKKVDKVSGKGLSTEDYTTAEQTKLAAITGSNTGDQDISGIDANSSTIGNLSTLTTTDKSNLVAAVNETDAALDLKADVTLSNLSNTSTARTNLGVAIGTNVQAYDADLEDLADGILSASKVENAITTAGTSGEVWTSDGSGAGTWSVPSSSVIQVGAGLVISGAGTVDSPYNITLPSGGTAGQVLTIGGDGVPAWADATGAVSIFYLDADGDGYGDANEPITSTSAPNGYVSNNTDCNDDDISIEQATTWYIDADGDGYGVSVISSCIRPSNGYLLSELSGTGTDDCNDGDANEKPGETWYIDVDGDGYPSSSTVSCVRPSNAYLLSELLGTDNDCIDSNSAINPGAAEVCDGIDNNCDGSIDEGLTLTTYYVDADGDGYGDSSDPGTSYCSNPGSGFKTNNTDCDDSNSAIKPGATEIGGNSIDENCDGNIYVVGDYVDGGVVFYVPTTPTDLNKDGVVDYGLVCSIDDLTSSGVKFYSNNISVDGTDRRKGFGKSNTDLLIADIGTSTQFAAGLAIAYRGGGFSDWYLPSKDELTAMYNNRDAINATAAINGGSDFAPKNNGYWSSYCIVQKAYYIDWTDGSTPYIAMTNLFGVLFNA